MPTKLTNETFIARAKLIHNNLYSYELVEYKNAHTKVKILCKSHGEFLQQPNSHLKGSGCAKCFYEAKATTAKSEFATKANLIHNNKYDYSLVEYKNNAIKVSIICKQHGEFPQAPSSHLSGSGCPHCVLQTTGWTRTKFKDKCIKNNESKGILYVLECFNDNERFIKIGITSRSIKQRYYGVNAMPYNYKILHEISGSPEFIYDLETLLHKKSKHYKYIPNTYFGGSSTECFEANPTYLSKLNDYLDFKKEEGVS